MLSVIVVLQITLLRIARQAQMADIRPLSVVNAQVVAKVGQLSKHTVALTELAEKQGPILLGVRVVNLLHLVPLGRNSLEVRSIPLKFRVFVHFNLDHQARP